MKSLSVQHCPSLHYSIGNQWLHKNDWTEQRFMSAVDPNRLGIMPNIFLFLSPAQWQQLAFRYETPTARMSLQQS
ncbi:hypothetical protein [Paraglaciecola sp. MB-3u-78]|uniref:hypothetical protein n=1 Tax=Paraglaciecola sp. MB-3u-78 TaxID=2058332 RepID=UPI0012FE9F73|nr:hypothetical protein [Paraglaciecola sp. MB-3u-78]